MNTESLKTAFCSISTINYLSYVQALHQSIRAVGHTNPHYVLIVDDPEKQHAELVNEQGWQAIYLHELEIAGVEELIKKYTAFELCNVLKPFFMRWLLNKHPEHQILMYLDSDTYLYSKLDEATQYLGEQDQISVALIPHFNDYQSYRQRTDYNLDKSYLEYGLYNGGFYALKNDQRAREFLDWQAEKLSDYGYNAVSATMFVDQKLLDLAPVVFDFVGIFKHPGYDVAFWNYFPGLITQQSGLYFAGETKLVFFHFSQLPKENFTANFIFNITEADKIIFRQMVDDYRAVLGQFQFEKISTIPYGYAALYVRPDLKLIDPLGFARVELKQQQQQNTALTATLNERDKELNTIYTSRSWRGAVLLRKLATSLIPNQKLRRTMVSGIWQLFKFSQRLFKFSSMHEGVVKKRRSINLNSKKLVLVDHSFHTKSLSINFLIEYLKQFYDLTIVYDESWMQKPFVDLSFIDDSYAGVIFFQNLPSIQALNQINNDNLIFFPMYDAAADWNRTQWSRLANLKIINFSKTLHDRLRSWGINSLYLQFFPKPNLFEPGKPDEIFFWQRRTEINFETIKPLFQNYPVKVHLHAAVDPYHQFVKPPEADEQKYSITYSEWFPNKADADALIAQKGIYIAPRAIEGIGQSFLEAMAMGKAVIAIDQPTMNEYIRHNETGYLFNPSKPEPIDFSNLAVVQQNAYNFIERGYRKWEQDKIQIIEYIKQP